MDTLSTCLVQLVPVVVASGLMKMVCTLLGPTMLNALPAESNTYQILNTLGDVGYYFLPVYCAYTASKKFGTNTLISMMLGALLIHPNIVNIVNAREPFTYLGIPMQLINYSASVLPTLLIVWIQSYIEKGLNKVLPKTLRFAFVPFLTVLIMSPLALCVLGPLGTFIGSLISKVIVGINSVFGPLSIAIVAALWPLLVSTGMHTTLRTFCITQLFTVGYDNIMLPSVMASYFAAVAVGVAYALKSETEENRSLGFSCAISQIFGGVTEPTIFGILFPNKDVWARMMIGSFAGGLYMGITNVACYILAPSVYLAPMSFGGPTSNTINGLIGCAISFVVTFALIFFTWTNKKEDLND